MHRNRSARGARGNWLALSALIVMLLTLLLLLLWAPTSTEATVAADQGVGVMEPAPPPAPEPAGAPPAPPSAPTPEPVAPPPPASPKLSVPILMYHVIAPGPNNLYVPPAELDAHLAYLAREGYQTVTLQQLHAHFQHGDNLPERPVALTFDDGYADFYTAALPLLQKHGMVGTLFVITGKVGQPGYITWQQAQAISAAGMEIGSHTVTHPDLRYLDPRRLRAELGDSRLLLEERLGVSVRFFAYPAGRYSDQTLALMPELYWGAVTTHPGVATPCQDVQQWRRIRVGPRLSGEALGRLIEHWERETKPERCQPKAPAPPRKPGPRGPHP
ncbi:MAG: polysaccharide deacetylase family protein [Bacillota bacterium]